VSSPTLRPSIHTGSPPHGNARGSSNVNCTSRFLTPTSRCATSASRPMNGDGLSSFTA